MIKNDFYPTQGTPSYGIEVTAPFMSITDLVNDMGNQYLMGYVNSDDISLVAPVEIINGGDTVTMSRVSGNFGWGYAQWGYTGSYGPGTLYYNDNGTLTRRWAINYDFTFLNAIEMSRVNTSPTLIPYISVAAIKSELIDGFSMSEFVNFGVDTVQGTSLDNFVENAYTIDGWKNMIDNDLPIFSGTVTIHDTSITVPLTLRPSDFEHENGVKFALIPTDNGYTLHCRIVGLEIGNTKYYYDTTHTINGNIVPFFQFPDMREYPTIVVPGTMLFSQIDLHYESGAIYVTQGSAGSSYYNNLFLQGDSGGNSRIFGGYDFGTISVNDVDFTRVFSNNRSWWCFIGNYVMISSSNTSGHAIFRVNAMYTPRDIYNYVRFWHKRTDTPSESYSTADTVTVFETSETPTSETVSGTLSEIAARLRPWQMPNVDITANTFTPEDIPIPEPEDADSSGDDIRDADFTNLVMSGANNFITMYAMTPSILTDFGEKMWAALGDQNFWESIATVFENDMSINPADILRYIISLRFFPFDLSTIPHDSFTGIYFGRATRPILPSSGTTYPMKINRSLWQINGGSVTIPKKYNDFRDYEPCTTVQVHVPFCGSVALAASEVMGKTLYISYKIDLQTGAMLATIGVGSNTYYIIATLAGSCGATIPITANNNIEYLQRVATVAEAAISGGHSSGNGAMSLMNNYSTSPLFDAPGMTIGGAVASAAGAYAHAVGALAGLPPVTVHKQGNATAFANLGGVNNAYVTIQRQRYEVPSNYGHTSGYACDISATVGNLSGYVVCSNVDTTSIPGFTANEVNEIKWLLESGVYV